MDKQREKLASLDDESGWNAMYGSHFFHQALNEGQKTSDAAKNAIDALKKYVQKHQIPREVVQRYEQEAFDRIPRRSYKWQLSEI